MGQQVTARQLAVRGALTVTALGAAARTVRASAPVAAVTAWAGVPLCADARKVDHVTVRAHP